MGLSGSLDIFQNYINNLVGDLEFVRTYLDNLLCLTYDSFDDYLNKLEIILKCLYSASLKCNVSKLGFCTDKIEYLEFYITQDRIKPINDKVQVILDLESPKNIKEVQYVLSMVQYYRDLWEK